MEINSATIKDLTFTDVGSSYEEDLYLRKSPIHKQKASDQDSTNGATEMETFMRTENTSEKSAPPKTIKLVPYRVKAVPRPKFKLLQKWEGTVIEVENNVIRAQIQDLLDRSTPLEEVTFSMDEVSKSDRPLVVQGAIFYWMIGYLDHVTGQRTRESRIVFRRLPGWKKDEVETVERESRPLIDLLPDSEAQALRKRFGLL